LQHYITEKNQLVWEKHCIPTHTTLFFPLLFTSLFFFLNLKLGVEPSRITSLFFFFAFSFFLFRAEGAALEK